MPVAVAMLAAVIERKTPTPTEVAALTVLSAGVMLAVWEGSVTGSVTGVVLCITALFSSAAMVSTTGKVRAWAPSGASGSTAAAGGLFRQLLRYCKVGPQAGLLCLMLHDLNPWQACLRCTDEVQRRPSWHSCPMLNLAQLLGQQSTGG